MQAAGSALALVPGGGGGSGAAAVVVTETRRFAGEDVTLERAYEPGSRAAREAAARAAAPRSGLDAAIAALAAPRALSALDKSRLDWAGAKAAAPGVAEDLARHVRSADTWRGQQDFLARAAAAEYEREREARLAATAPQRARR
jgi:hypothetical protein